VTNVRVAGHLVDALFPEERVIVELDSWGFHRDRVSFEDNRERDAATLEAGYITIRLTSERWSTDRQRETARLQDILDQRRNGRL
jgi:very-short-patch-repair endonuclease